MFETIKSGGLIMIPLFICGIIATYIIIERCIYFYKIKKSDVQLMNSVNASLANRDYESCSSACVMSGTPLAQVIKKALDYRRYDEADVKELVEAEMDFVIPKLEHLITPLGTIANIATLLGLLGTVTGNIKAFGVLGAGGTMGDPALLAGAIAEALVTTVAGLSISIPSLIFHNYFVSKVNRCIVEMEAHVTSMMLKLSGRII
jgi:biopolymer transport protein ExbB